MTNTGFLCRIARIEWAASVRGVAGIFFEHRFSFNEYSWSASGTNGVLSLIPITSATYGIDQAAAQCSSDKENLGPFSSLLPRPDWNCFQPLPTATLVSTMCLPPGPWGLWTATKGEAYLIYIMSNPEVFICFSCHHVSVRGARHHPPDRSRGTVCICSFSSFAVFGLSYYHAGSPRKSRLAAASAVCLGFPCEPLEYVQSYRSRLPQIHLFT
jgi:hypothetical protein